MNRKGLVLLWALATSSVCAHAFDPATAGRDGLVVVANRNVAESEALARFYAERRGVPAERVLVFDLPASETMSRADYETRLREPLLAALRELKLVDQVRRDARLVADHDSGWHTVRASVRTVLLMRGVPLRIDDTKPWPLEKLANLVNHGVQRDEAAVDTELCLALFDSYDIRGRVVNPMYNQLRWEVGASGAPLLLVTRLDGLTPDLVRGQIEQALHAERFGLHGRVYVDQRTPRTDDYQVGDYWLDESAQRLLREGYDVAMERTDAVFGARYPMNDAAIYLGWYTEEVTGPFARTDFVFRAGAIAYHNHSANAKTLRSATNHWCGPLLARGATVTLGAVAEPFLGYTPHLPILVDRLCNGLTWAEASYLSLSVLSWQTTVVGDPLYRPFALTLDEQVRRLEEANDPALAEACVRVANRMVRDGRLNPALRYLRDRIKARPHPALHTKLAELYAQNELFDEAGRQYELALDGVTSAEAAVRVAARYVTLLEALGKKELRTAVEQKVRARWPESPILEALPPVP